jgi:hypothetical protein
VSIPAIIGIGVAAWLLVALLVGVFAGTGMDRMGK